VGADRRQGGVGDAQLVEKTGDHRVRAHVSRET
jgi:hypothetical protein